MNKSVIKFWNKIIILLLGFIGTFTSCNKIASDYDCVYYPVIERDTGENVVVMYGILSTNYVILKGTVMNQENLQPIQNIKVIKQIDGQFADVSLTDSTGKYVLDYGYYESNLKKVVNLKIEDIDGKDNGGDFKTKEVKIKLTEDDKEKMDKCNQNGGWFVKIQNIQLKKK